jgi:uncharacterized Zn finger protein (UPF0148 family)
MPLHRITCDECGTVIQTDHEAVVCPRCQRIVRGVDLPRVDTRDIPGTRSYDRDMAREKYGDEP